jgi:alkanesulfonate monooxygenase SsuD/methylene tetrahydromethanopterin reductase-like flavin-dependent oxidoreductase (luciferase family)
VTVDGVVRATAAEALAVWAETARIHGLEDRLGSDGSDRGLTIGGSLDEVAAYVDRLARVGIREVTFTFRAPFDLETIQRVGELRAALTG